MPQARCWRGQGILVSSRDPARWHRSSNDSLRVTARSLATGATGERLADIIREIPGPSGLLEALLDSPKDAPRAVVVFAHPLPIEGGTMHTKVVFQSAKALTRIGCAVLRFNFRGVGRSAGTWDEGRGEKDDFRAALDFAATRFPKLEIWAA